MIFPGRCGVYIVYVVGNRPKLRVLAGRWQRNFKTRLPERVKREELVEHIGSSMAVFVFKRSLMGLWLALKLRSIAEDLGLLVWLYRSEAVDNIEGLVEAEIKKRLDRIPLDLVPLIKQAFEGLRLPRKRRGEVIEAMIV
jgi:hypothetical protein